MSPIQSGFSECHDYLLPLFCALKNYSLSYKECGEPCHIILYMEALMCNIGDLFLSLSLSLSRFPTEIALPLSPLSIFDKKICNAKKEVTLIIASRV